MLRILSYILIGVATSLFMFPFNLPLENLTVNTKMIMAVFGAALMVYDKIRGEGPAVNKDFFLLSLLCACISVWALMASVLNETADLTFAKYLISVWVWLGAAYAIIWLIRACHGQVSVELIGHYMIGVCTAQCLLAYAMTIWPALGSFIDSLMGDGELFMSATRNRLHGLGAALDPSGLRFSAVLAIIAYLSAHTDYNLKPWKGALYLIAFVIISVFGNMIARTTTVGVITAIILFVSMRWPRDNKLSLDRSWGIIGGGLLIIVVLSAWLYNVNPAFRSNLRFGFEGFFSLVEKGKWEVHSNEVLKGMIVWPETLKTWVIGDGYFDNPQDLPDFLGRVRGGFYMKTDIGYLRYIFYFGCIGLIGMICVFIQLTSTCIRNLKGYTILFLTLLLINYIGWIKVSSDIIMIFAPFVILAYQEASECTSSTT